MAVRIGPKFVASKIPPRRAWSRKGENGRVLVVGGSRVFHGAPTLAALAAYRTGVDLVYLAVPQQLAAPVRGISPSFIVIPLPDFKLTKGSVNRLLKWLPEVHSAALGMGLGAQPMEGARLLAQDLCTRGIKLVVDGDALRREVVEVLGGREAVLTPHAGEFHRLTGVEVSRSLQERVKAVLEAAKKLGVAILLKGKVDVISDGERAAYNTTGTPSMTVGGTGDVLAGLVAGFLAKGVPPFEAASIGAYINGLAGEKASDRLGLHILPTDVLEEIPAVLKPFDRIQE